MPAGGLPAAIERPAFFRCAAVRPPMRFPTAWAFLLAKDRPHDFFRQALFLRPSVTIHSADIAAVYGIGALILILAVLLAAVTVVRLKPRMILSEME